MVSNTQIGRSFKGVVQYQFTGRRNQPVDKQAEILSSRGVRTGSATEMTADFEMGRLANPRLGNAVWHVSLSFNPVDATRLDSALMRTIAEDYLKKMKLDKTQYVIVRHHDTPGNQHLHIIANRVDDEGKTVADGRNFYRSKEALRELVQKYGLTPPDKLRSEKQHPEKLQGSEATRYELRQALGQTLTTATQLAEIEATLQAKGIEVRYHRNKTGEPTGISFAKDGVAYKGSDLARHYSLTGIQKQLAQTRYQQAHPASEELGTGILVETVVGPAGSTQEGQLSVAGTPDESIQKIGSAVLPSLAIGVKLQSTNEPTTELVASSTPGVEVEDSLGATGKLVMAAATMMSGALPLQSVEAAPTILVTPDASLQEPVQQSPKWPAASSVESTAEYWTHFDQELADWQAGRTPEAQQAAWDDAWLAHCERAEKTQQVVAQVAQVSLTTGASLPHLLAMEGLELVVEADEIRVRHRDTGDLFTVEEVPISTTALAVPVQDSVQYGCIELGALGGKSGEERLNLCRSFLEKTGMRIGQIEPVAPDGLARLDYCFHVQQANLVEVAQCLNQLQQRENTRVYEAPHPLREPTAPAFGLAVPRPQWREREGQFNQAQIRVSSVVSAQRAQATRISQMLQQEGIAVSAIIQDSPDHLGLVGTYHTHRAEVTRLNALLDGAALIPGVMVEETSQQVAERRQGAAVSEQAGKSATTFEFTR
jgi:hypothetical protein